MTTKPRTLFEYLADEGERPYLLAAFDGKLDDTKRRAYAQFLEGRDPIRAEWLRLEMRLQAQATSDIAVRERFRELSRQIGPDFVRTLRRQDILNCGRDVDKPRFVRFSFICSKRWETLLPTDKPDERHCDECQSRVYQCKTLGDAESHALAGHCIAVSYDLVEKGAGGSYRNAVGRPDPIRDWGEKLFHED